MKKKLLIFDFDDTLCATQFSHIDTLAKLISEKYRVEASKVLQAYKFAEKQIGNSKEFPSIEEFYKQFNIKLLDKLGLDSTEKGLEELAVLVNQMREVAKKNSTIYPNLIETLTLLKKEGYKMTILSGSWDKKIKEISKDYINKKIDRVHEILKNTDLDKFFDAVFICWEDGIFKPDRTAFEKVLKHFKVAPEEAVMIGNEEVDMAASKIGITTILFNTENKYNKKINPHHTFKNYKDLPKIINIL